MSGDPVKTDQQENQVPFIAKDDDEIGSKKRRPFRRKIRGLCTVKMLKRRLPLLRWIPDCTVPSVLWDFMAGFTVALTSIPQSIAFAAVAGLPLEIGLYTAFAGPVVYSIFGSVRHLTLGPTTLTV